MSPNVLLVLKSTNSFLFLLLLLLLLLNIADLCNGGVASSFVRKVDKTIDMPLDSDVFKVPPGYNAPQQVHIKQGDDLGKGVIVSWVTMDEPGSNTLLYWSGHTKQIKRHELGLPPINSIIILLVTFTIALLIILRFSFTNGCIAIGLQLFWHFTLLRRHATQNTPNGCAVAVYWSECCPCFNNYSSL